MPDWLIVGGGIPALVSAFYLQQRGASVLVIDNNTPSASRGGAGILSPLPPWHYPPPLRDLAAAGAAAYPSLLAALGDDCSHRAPGMLVLPPHDDDALTAWRRGGGQASATRANHHCAALPPQPALHLPSVTTLNPRLLIKALRRRLPRRIATVARLAYSGDRLQHIELTDGSRLAAGDVLLSAGAWSSALCPPPQPDITPVRGQLLLYDNPDNITLPPIVLHEQQRFYLLQRPDARLLAGSTSEHAGFNDIPTAAAAALLARRAAALLPPLRHRRPRATWSGLRPAAAAPIIARHPRLENLHLNSGHHRYGVTMAPAAAAHLLHLLDNTIPPQDNPYPLPRLTARRSLFI